MKRLKAVVLIITLVTGILGVVVTDTSTNNANIETAEYSAYNTVSVTNGPSPTPVTIVEEDKTEPVPEKLFLVSDVQALSITQLEPAAFENMSVFQESDGEMPEIPEIVIADINDSEDPEPDKTKKQGSVTIKKEDIPTPPPVKNDNASQGNKTENGVESGNSSGDSANKPAEEYITTVKVGIDVSKWNGKINWKKVADSGVEFAMIRTGYRGNTYGNIVVDPMFYDNIEGALANGIEVGVYFYSQAVNEKEARQEAAWVCKLIEDYNITYPVAYDLEEVGTNRIKGVSYSQLNKNARAFLDYVNGQGYWGSMYGCKSYLEDIWNMSLYNDCHVWLAHYTKQTTYKGRYDMWQYTENGKVNGITTSVDLNYAYIKEKVSSPDEENPEELPEVTPVPDESPEGFTAADEQCVVVLPDGALDVRALPNDEAAIIGSLENGAIVHRTGVSDTGWSEIEYDGIKAYASSEYLQPYPDASEDNQENGSESNGDADNDVTGDEEVPGNDSESEDSAVPSPTPTPIVTEENGLAVIPYITRKTV